MMFFSTKVTNTSDDYIPPFIYFDHYLYIITLEPPNLVNTNLSEANLSL